MSAKLPENPKPNTTQTSLPTGNQHNDMGSFKIVLPHGPKFKDTENT
jgi:hypothetical protein